MIPNHVRQAYLLKGPTHQLSGGSVDVYRVGDLVVKQLHPTSLETPHSLQLAPWLAALLIDVPRDGFRISRPVPSQNGKWMLDDGWTAWTFVKGQAVSPQDIPAAIKAINTLHQALSRVPTHPLLAQNTSPWGFAEKHCWGSRPEWVHPVLADWVDAL